MPVLAAVIAGIMFIVGVVAFTIGMRGRRVDDHPVCRRCGYDLSGAEAPPTVCPECGRAIAARRRAVRTGNRRKRPIMASLGAVITALSIAMAGLMAGLFLYGQAQEFDWNTIKPVWWLERDLASADARVRTAAATELHRRLQNDDLDRGDVDGAVPTLFALQKDWTIPWADEYGLFIELAHSKNLVDDETFYSYLQQAVSNVSVHSRERVHAGDEMPIRIQQNRTRVSKNFGRMQSGVPPMYWFSAHVTGMRSADGQVSITYPSHGGGHLGLNGGNGGSMTSWFPVIDIPPGAQDVIVQIELSVEQQAPGSPYRTIRVWRDELPLSLEVVPEDEPLITLIDDPALAAGIRKSIFLDLANRRIALSGNSSTVSPTPGYVQIREPPVGVAFDIFARGASGREAHLGTRAIPAGAVDHAGWLFKDLEKLFPDATHIDIVFRSNAEVAKKDEDVTEMWVGELVFEDVPLASADDEGGESDDNEADESDGSDDSQSGSRE